MFFEPLSKCSRWFTNVFLITLHLSHWYLYDSTFFWMVSWSFGAIRRFLIVSSLKVNLHSIFTACSFLTFTDPLVVWDHYMRPLDVTASVLGAFCVVVAHSSGFHLSFVQCPCRIFASCKCLFQMFSLLFQQFRIRADGICSMLQWTYYIIPGWNCMVTVWLEVQVSMCRFPVHCSLQYCSLPYSNMHRCCLRFHQCPSCFQ